MNKTRLRIRFTKSGDLRWISHRDLARLWERLLRRAELKLAFSQGFHPKPRISFPSALALGVEALDELVELEIEGAFQLAEIEQRIRKQIPAGMQLLSIQSLDNVKGKAKIEGFTFCLSIPNELRPAVGQRIKQLLSQPQFEVQRDTRTIRCSTDHPGFELKLAGDRLVFRLPNFQQGSIKARDVLAALEIEYLLEEGAILQRTEVHLASSATPPASSAQDTSRFSSAAPAPSPDPNHRSAQ